VRLPYRDRDSLIGFDTVDHWFCEDSLCQPVSIRTCRAMIHWRIKAMRSDDIRRALLAIR
jgi:hypothetical protein